MYTLGGINPELLRKCYEKTSNSQRKRELLIKIYSMTTGTDGIFFLNKEEPSKEQYEELGIGISLLLPKILDRRLMMLCEIDDLIIPNFNQLNDDSLRLPSDEILRRVVSDISNFYSNHFFKRALDINLVAPLCQVAKISDHSGLPYAVCRIAEDFIETWNLQKACLALKLMRILVNRGDYKYFKTETIEWWYTLRNIPHPKCPKKQRIAAWMGRQSKILFDHLAGQQKSDFVKYHAYLFNPPSNVIDMVKLGSKITLDFVYSYFMGSDDESQRIKLIESFVRACLERPYQESKWNELEKYLCRYRCKSYLSEKSGGSNEVRMWGDQPTDDEDKYSLNSEPEDLTIKKHIFFDTFLNRLELINILRTVFWKTPEILEMEKFSDSYEAMVFWNWHDPFNTRTAVTDAMRNPDLLAREAKWLEFTLKMCPFLYLSKVQEHLADDLLKVIRGEEVDEATLEELYFAVNDMTHSVHSIK